METDFLDRFVAGLDPAQRKYLAGILATPKRPKKRKGYFPCKVMVALADGAIYRLSVLGQDESGTGAAKQAIATATAIHCSRHARRWEWRRDGGGGRWALRPVYPKPDVLYAEIIGGHHVDTGKSA